MLPPAIIEDRKRVEAEQALLTDQMERTRTYDTLGLWYANTLYKCGASEEELMELLTEASGSESTPKRKTWQQVVRKMYANQLAQLSNRMS